MKDRTRSSHSFCLGDRSKSMGRSSVSLCETVLRRTVLPPRTARKRECVRFASFGTGPRVANQSRLRIDFLRPSNDSFIQVFELQLPPPEGIHWPAIIQGLPF